MANKNATREGGREAVWRIKRSRGDGGMGSADAKERGQDGPEKVVGARRVGIIVQGKEEGV